MGFASGRNAEKKKSQANIIQAWLALTTSGWVPGGVFKLLWVLLDSEDVRTFRHLEQLLYQEDGVQS